MACRLGCPCHTPSCQKWPLGQRRPKSLLPKAYCAASQIDLVTHMTRSVFSELRMGVFRMRAKVAQHATVHFSLTRNSLGIAMREDENSFLHCPLSNTRNSKRTLCMYLGD